MRKRDVYCDHFDVGNDYFNVYFDYFNVYYDHFDVYNRLFDYYNGIFILFFINYYFISILFLIILYYSPVTTRYMAPELLDSSDRYPSADIFSLGLTLYETCISCLPEHRESVAQGSSPLPSEGPLWHVLRDGEAEDPPQRCRALCSVIRSCMRAMASDRPSAADILSIPDVVILTRGLDFSLIAPSARAAPIPLTRASSYIEGMNAEILTDKKDHTDKNDKSHKYDKNNKTEQTETTEGVEKEQTSERISEKVAIKRVSSAQLSEAGHLVAVTTVSGLGPTDDERVLTPTGPNGCGTTSFWHPTGKKWSDKDKENKHSKDVKGEKGMDEKLSASRSLMDCSPLFASSFSSNSNRIASSLDGRNSASTTCTDHSTNTTNCDSSGSSFHFADSQCNFLTDWNSPTSPNASASSQGAAEGSFQLGSEHGDGRSVGRGVARDVARDVGRGVGRVGGQDEGRGLVRGVRRGSAGGALGGVVGSPMGRYEGGVEGTKGGPRVLSSGAESFPPPSGFKRDKMDKAGGIGQGGACIGAGMDYRVSHEVNQLNQR